MKTVILVCLVISALVHLSKIIIAIYEAAQPLRAVDASQDGSQSDNSGASRQ